MPNPEELFLEGPEERFDAAVAFGLADERRRRRHAWKGDLAQEIATEIDDAVVVPQRESVGGRGGQPAEVVADALAELKAELKGLEAIAMPRRGGPTHSAG